MMSRAESEGDFPAKEDVDALLEEFGRDYRAALRALLHDLAVFARDADEASVAFALAHGIIPKCVQPRRS